MKLFIISSLFFMVLINSLLAAPKNPFHSPTHENITAPEKIKFIKIRYAKAQDIKNTFKQYHIIVDKRTNGLWINESKKKSEQLLKLIKQLDVPVKQVLIKAKIVMIDKHFEDEMGIRFGITGHKISGTLAGSSDSKNFKDRLSVDLPALPSTGNAASIGIALAKLGSGIFLDLELSALESEGHGKIISSPQLLTLNRHTASIESGEEIPYQEKTSHGNTAIAFKKAVLSLTVTPSITDNKKIILALKVNLDTASTEKFNGVPAIKTKEIQTEVEVKNGETIVLGGIYKQFKSQNIKRVPFFSKLPLLGHLFRYKNKIDQEEELLIFVTPQIIK